MNIYQHRWDKLKSQWSYFALCGDCNNIVTTDNSLIFVLLTSETHLCSYKYWFVVKFPSLKGIKTFEVKQKIHICLLESSTDVEECTGGVSHTSDSL